jgi:hypothetical protein
MPSGPHPEESVKPSQAPTELRNLLESALLLAESPKHQTALKLILEASLATLGKDEATNKTFT